MDIYSPSACAAEGSSSRHPLPFSSSSSSCGRVASAQEAMEYHPMGGVSPPTLQQVLTSGFLTLPQNSIYLLFFGHSLGVIPGAFVLLCGRRLWLHHLPAAARVPLGQGAGGGGASGSRRRRRRRRRKRRRSGGCGGCGGDMPAATASIAAASQPALRGGLGQDTDAGEEKSTLPRTYKNNNLGIPFFLS